MHTYSYLAASSRNLTLKFIFQNDNKHNWYLDDVSVKDSTSAEMMTNGNFENSSSLTGWITAGPGSCSSFGVSTTTFYSSNHSYYYQCGSQTAWIYQSFAAISGQIYNVSFWSYCYRTGPGNGAGTNQLDVYMY